MASPLNHGTTTSIPDAQQQDNQQSGPAAQEPLQSGSPDMPSPLDGHSQPNTEPPKQFSSNSGVVQQEIPVSGAQPNDSSSQSGLELPEPFSFEPRDDQQRLSVPLSPAHQTQANEHANSGSSSNEDGIISHEHSSLTTSDNYSSATNYGRLMFPELQHENSGAIPNEDGTVSDKDFSTTNSSSVPSELLSESYEGGINREVIWEGFDSVYDTNGHSNTTNNFQHVAGGLEQAERNQVAASDGSSKNSRSPEGSVTTADAEMMSQPTRQRTLRAPISNLTRLILESRVTTTNTFENNLESEAARQSGSSNSGVQTASPLPVTTPQPTFHSSSATLTPSQQPAREPQPTTTPRNDGNNDPSNVSGGSAAPTSSPQNTSSQLWRGIRSRLPSFGVI
jgi:hypothetical protein